MNYCTWLPGRIVINGVPKEDWEILQEALEAIRSQEELDGMTERSRQMVDSLEAFDTPFRTRTGWGDTPKSTELCDLEFSVYEDCLALEGTEYTGGSRYSVCQQINWVLSWLKSRYPGVTFSGRLEEWDGEAPGPPVWYELAGNGELVEEVHTHIVPVPREE